MFPARYNLIAVPWLPARRRSGVVEQIPPWRITDRIDEDPFVAVAWPRPDFNGAAHEWLVGLLSTAAAPEDDEEWEDWWLNPPSPETLRKRFARIAGAFNLDGPGPRFLQDLDPLEGADGRAVSALLIDAPGANALRNNTDLFVKRGGAPVVMSRAAAAMALYTLNAYAPTGGAGHRTSLRGGGPLTTLIVASHQDYGETLWGRLWPNVETMEQISARSTEAVLPDELETIFPWLTSTRASNPKGGRPTTPVDVHPLQVYWGMPRRIRLQFEDAQDRLCGLTGAADTVVVTSFRTRNYGTNYTDGFEHPLTPYYRQRQGTIRLPVHPGPSGISYRHWPGLVVPSDDKLRDPAGAVRHLPERNSLRGKVRFTAFGYDMDNMKARAWIESEMPLWILASVTSRDHLRAFVRHATAGADTVSRLLVWAVKSARYDRPSEATGDYGFIGDRFFRETEEDFYEKVREAVGLIDDAHDDPTAPVREQWAPAIAKTALRLFDEYVPAEEIESRSMQRYVKARVSLDLAGAGRGKAGRSLFGDLGIVPPEPKKRRSAVQEDT